MHQSAGSLCTYDVRLATKGKLTEIISVMDPEGEAGARKH